MALEALVKHVGFVKIGLTDHQREANLRIFPVILCAAVAAPSLSQALDIPEPVIAQCNAAGSASELPTCLREGAVAYGMLELVRSDAFYGAAADPVIEICAERNDTFAQQWTCFRNAASSAAETRELIGLENIADRCVAGISDVELAPRIVDEYRQRRNAAFPGQSYFGASMYYPFQGCPEPAVEESTAPAGLAPSVTRVGSNASNEGREVYSTEACSAYAEIGTLIETAHADRLRSIASGMETLEETDAARLASATGLSGDTADFVISGSENQRRYLAFLLGGFLEANHPELLDEYFAHHEVASGDPAGEQNAAIARNFASGIFRNAHQSYRDNCSAS
jgi:hypothetical protein